MITTPVIVERTNQCSHIISSLSEMIYLMQEHGMTGEIRAEDGNVLKLWAKVETAILMERATV